MPNEPNDSNDGKSWSDVDIAGLYGSLKQGNSVEEAARFLCRQGTINDVRAIAMRLVDVAYSGDRSWRTQVPTGKGMVFKNGRLDALVFNVRASGRIDSPIFVIDDATAADYPQAMEEVARAIRFYRGAVVLGPGCKREPA